MAWKKTAFFFWFQTLKYARKWADVRATGRYYERWKSSQVAGRSSVGDEWAWINFAALDLLDGWLQPTHRVFEYGGGGSTLFFAKRVAFVATVEHDAGWFDILTQKVHEKGYTHWEGYSVQGQPLASPQPQRSAADPADFASASKGFENQSFEAYATTIHRYPEQHFDLILVDGRSRASCIQEAFRHLKPGGWLVIDNAERERYLTAFRDTFTRDFTVVLDQVGPVPYTPDFTKTLILRKLD